MSHLVAPPVIECPLWQLHFPPKMRVSQRSLLCTRQPLSKATDSRTGSCCTIPLRQITSGREFWRHLTPNRRASPTMNGVQRWKEHVFRRSSLLPLKLPPRRSPKNRREREKRSHAGEGRKSTVVNHEMGSRALQISGPLHAEQVGVPRSDAHQAFLHVHFISPKRCTLLLLQFPHF